jgi:hypothetical protein
MNSSLKRIVACKCGAVKLELTGDPIVAAVCHCDDCQRGSAEIECLPGAPKILDPWSGTPYVLYRKDRVRVLQGRELLSEQRLKEGAKTRRVVASCCNSPLFVDFAPGHWVSLYQQLFDAPVPQARVRNQTRFMPPGGVPDDGLPLHRGYPPGLIARLLAARVAMGIRRKAAEL